MKKTFIILVFLTFSNLCLFSQFTKGDVLLDLSGSYVESSDGSNGGISSFSSKNKTLEMSISLGTCFSNSFSIGFGLNYGHVNKTDLTRFLFYQRYYLIDQTETKASIIAPGVYLRYNKNVFGKLWFMAEFNTAYGFIDSGYESLSAGSENKESEDLEPSLSFVNSYESGDKSGLLNVSLSPEFAYFLGDKVGLMIKIGGIQYTSYDFEEHEWKVSVNPSTWEYGIFFRFQKKQPEA